MENYKYTSYYNNITCTNSTKEIHKLWNEDLNCGVVYHTSTKTGKIIKMWLQIDYVTIPLANGISTDYAVHMLDTLYSRLYVKLSKK